MRIGYITSTFPKYRKDSWGVFILDLAQGLALRKNDIFVITQRYRKSRKHEKFNEITVSRFNWLFPKKFKRLADYKRIPYIRMISYVLSGVYRTIKSIRTSDVQLLHTNWAVPSGFIGLIAKKITGRPLLVYVHGSDINMWLKKPVIRSLVIQTLKNVDGIITVNNKLLETINKLEIKNCVKSVIPMGVDLKKFQDLPMKISNQIHTILFVGALRQVKGLDFLIRSLPLIKEEIPQFKLLIAGDGPLRTNLEKKVQERGLSQYVEFLGQVSHPEAINLVRSADVVVLPSLSEGTPTVMFEALVCKTPLIASRVGGIPEILRHGETGYLIHPGNAQAIADAVVYLLKNDEIRNKIAINGYELIKNRYTTDKTVDKILAVWAAIMRRFIEAKH